MKLLKTAFLSLVLGGASLQAQVKETPATIALEQGGNPQGFIQGSKPGGILFSPTQGVRGVEYSFSQIRGNGIDELIRLESHSEILADPRADFSEGKYLEAAKGFAKVVNDYQQLVLYIPQNFASEAMFYQIESLRRMGNYKALGPLLASPAGKSIDTMLSDRYKKFVKYQKLWAVYGSGDMAALEKELVAYQVPVTGTASLLPAPNFIKMAQNELVQIAFLRAEVYKSKGETDKAIQDYFRTFSMTFAYDQFLTKQAMGASLVLQAQNPALKSENEKVRKAPLRQIQSVAYFFSHRFPNDMAMPDQLKQYVVRPEVDVVLAPKEEEAAPADPAAKPEAAPGAPGAGAAPDGKGAPDDKGKGAPDGKGKGVPDDKGKGVPDDKGKGVPDDKGKGAPDDKGKGTPKKGNADKGK